MGSDIQRSHTQSVTCCDDWMQIHYIYIYILIFKLILTWILLCKGQQDNINGMTRHNTNLRTSFSTTSSSEWLIPVSVTSRSNNLLSKREDLPQTQLPQRTVFHKHRPKTLDQHIIGSCIFDKISQSLWCVRTNVRRESRYRCGPVPVSFPRCLLVHSWFPIFVITKGNFLIQGNWSSRSQTSVFVDVAKQFHIILSKLDAGIHQVCVDWG